MLTIRRLAGHLGAETTLDLTALAPDRFAALRAIWLTHKVVVVRDCGLTADALIEFAARFGPLLEHPFLPVDPARPALIVLDSDRPFAADWHTDGTFEPEPPMTTLLKMDVCPEAGGDTLFADSEAAFSLLTSSLQEFLSQLSAVHVTPDGDRRAEHPVVRVHPETGRRSLFVNRHFTRELVGLSPSESRAILDLLFDVCESPDVQCRVRWAPNTLAFWDNRCTQHRVVGDYSERRRAERVSVLGDAPFGPQ